MHAFAPPTPTVNHMWPCSALQLHPSAVIACDEVPRCCAIVASPRQDATLELKVRTVKYFRGLAAMEEGVPAAQRTTRGRAHSGAIDYTA